MAEESLTKLSKFLSYVLRHHPEAINLELDVQGWAHISTLIQKAEKYGRKISRDQILEVIHSGGKQRFIISEDEDFIRAGYGHSIDIELSLQPKTPPEVLFHGTAEKNIDSIFEKGLVPWNRNFVHLSQNIEDAALVGQRHGKPIILTIQAFDMHSADFSFYQSESEPGIWMVTNVPAQYISQNVVSSE